MVYPRQIGATHGLPSEYDAAIRDWEEVRSFLEALVKSRRGIVVEITHDDLIFAQFRGRLHPHPGPPLIGWDGKDAFDVGDWRGRGRFGVEKRASYLVLDPSRFAGGHLATDDDDDYFFLTLRMGQATITLMDSSSH